MSGIINSFKWIINFFKTIFSIISTIFETIATAFNYMITIVQLSFTTIATLPTWLKAFAIITISISIVYFIIGRDTGKSE